MKKTRSGTQFILAHWYQCLIVCLSVLGSSLQADELNIVVHSASGHAAGNMVLYATSLNPEILNEAKSTDPQHSAVMDQVNSQFVPHILVVEKDSWVTFPNSDSIKHHVYSFSQAKPFELKLYGEGQPAPLQFNNGGEVVLGCNIHDWMLGYVFVVDTPWFAKTNDKGLANIALPKGEYELKLWSPLLQGKDKQFSTIVNVNGTSEYLIQLTEALLPTFSEYEHADELDDY